MFCFALRRNDRSLPDGRAASAQIGSDPRSHARNLSSCCRVQTHLSMSKEFFPSRGSVAKPAFPRSSCAGERAAAAEPTRATVLLVARWSCPGPRDRPTTESGDGGHERRRTEDGGARLCADVAPEIPPGRRAFHARWTGGGVGRRTLGRWPWGTAPRVRQRFEQAGLRAARPVDG
jgi:hypothetical protein